MNWKLVYTRQAQKDAKKLAEAGLKDNAIAMLENLGRNPYETPPPVKSPFCFSKGGGV